MSKFLLPFVLCAFAVSAHAELRRTRTVSYYEGTHSVTVPERVTRVATAWEAHNATLAMLGYGDKIVATTRIVREMPIFRKFVPGIADAALASAAGSADLNVEELIFLNPDVVFVASAPPVAKLEQLRKAGIAIAPLRYNSLAAVVERTVITGEILGPDAHRRALQYKEYFNRNVQRVKERLATLPAHRRLKVYHPVSNPTSTFGRPSLVQDWMDLGGAINIAEHWFRGLPNASGTVSIEDVMTADPDVIVVMRASHAEEIRTDKRWSTLRAVRNGRVYANPRGLFWWGRETAEEALQFLWLAKLLYPDRMRDIDMPEETRQFYERFFGYRLSDDEIAEFLNPRS